MSPTERELDALKVLWSHGEATVRDVFTELSQQGEPLAYTTVLSLFQVMEQKGLVAHRKEGKAYVYRSLVGRRSTFRRLADSFLKRVFDGAVDEYLVHAIAGKKLSDAELDSLEAMIDEARRIRDSASDNNRRCRKRED
ncbi:MAG: BlaI/MecI/CopY family transcriptional regulator [Planctomycetales bacterium]|nr:BlaI/MecI/CopY family transcriptional regulator [Planctomycetales bacterium]